MSFADPLTFPTKPSKTSVLATDGDSRSSTTELLGHILSAIQESRPMLIKVVEFLLMEQQSSLHPPPAASFPCPLTRPSLRALASPSLTGKRKRSITHFEGIPLSVVSATSPSIPSQMLERPKKVITMKRILRLYRSMSEMSIGGACLREEKQRLKPVRDLESGCLDDDGSFVNQEDEYEESDSDDEDDVVLVFHQ